MKALGAPRAIEQPIFIVGMPRSGTTAIHEAFSARPDVAWFSRPLNLLPRYPIVSALERFANLHPALRSSMPRSDQLGSGLRRLRRLERLRLGPTEGIDVWRHWFGERIVYEFMLGIDATASERERAHRLVSKLLRYEGRRRLVAKLTGPGRLRYLSSLFADALFLHVIRDGRAVVNSLIRFPAWRDTFRLREPAWSGGLNDDNLAMWRESGGSPLALAAVEWKAVIEATRREATELDGDRYREIRYEDFVADPHGTLDQITRFCRLPHAPEAHQFVDRRIRPRDMNYRWRHGFDEEEVQLLDRIMGDLLHELGYR